MSIAEGIVVLRVWLVSIVACRCPGTGEWFHLEMALLLPLHCVDGKMVFNCCCLLLFDHDFVYHQVLIHHSRASSVALQNMYTKKSHTSSSFFIFLSSSFSLLQCCGKNLFIYYISTSDSAVITASNQIQLLSVPELWSVHPITAKLVDGKKIIPSDSCEIEILKDAPRELNPKPTFSSWHHPSQVPASRHLSVSLD